MAQSRNSISLRSRFEFGRNWQRFLKVLDEDRIAEAVRSLKEMLEIEDLNGKSFLDIGSGSGLFSLAARRLGARVQSFDYDQQSVECTKELKRKYYKNDSDWLIEKGSVLDTGYLSKLGHYDVVYAWGVLHHTGQMWQAMKNVVELVAPAGCLYVSIYNDQGLTSDIWRFVKRAYNRLPGATGNLVLIAAFIRLWLPTAIRDIFQYGKFKTWKNYSATRSMSPWHDVVDWVGGYPFEVAKPNEVLHFYSELGFKPQQIKTCGKGRGCNEFVFRRDGVA
jgi:2-polyprenyl-3-methyl-5-hydroxy-6-metoxy-1,4-benzoquinol methylase